MLAFFVCAEIALHVLLASTEAPSWAHQLDQL